MSDGMGACNGMRALAVIYPRGMPVEVEDPKEIWWGCFEVVCWRENIEVLMNTLDGVGCFGYQQLVTFTMVDLLEGL